MHLREVQMENFKSFGRKLTVPFEPGFTAITGPNGSGKSNIGDAVMFVLSPNTPRAMRAKNLADLIYNGGAGGKGSDQCVVSLVFDNVDRTMPVDADTVTLTRKVKLAPTKEDPGAYNSYFYVNGRASQKKEFVDLLDHARISADGYNITLQGDVTHICNMTPMERRTILDDIAGVTTFDRDITQADRQKADVQANLERIRIVLDEIKRTLDQLDREKEAAVKYRDLQAAVKRLKGLMAWRRKADLATQIAQVADQVAKFTAEQDKVRAGLDELKAKHTDAQARFAEVEAKIREQGGEEVAKIQESIKAARDAMVRLEEKINYAKAEAQQAQEDTAPLTEELRKAEKELATTKQLQAKATTDAAAANKALAANKADLEGVRDLISKSDSGAMQINRELTSLKVEHEKAQLALHEAKLESDRLAEKAKGLDRAIDETQSSLEVTGKDLDETAWNLKELKQVSGGSGKKRQDQEKRLFALRKEQAELAQQHQEIDGRIRRLHREVAELSAAQAAAAQQSGSNTPAVDAILKAREKREIRGIVGTISELAKVQDEHKHALQIAASGRLSAIVVEDDAVAAECIDLLKKTGAGRATFLPLTKMVPGRPRGQALMKVKEQGCLGFALDLIKFNERYQNAFFHVFGDTLVADSMATGRRMMGGVRIVTLDGELFEASGAMTGGNAGKKRKDDELGFTNADRGRMDEAMQEAAQAEEAEKVLAVRIGELRIAIEQLQAQMDSEGRQAGNHEETLKDKERKAEVLAERKTTLEEALAGLRRERREAEKAEHAGTAAIETLTARLKELERSRVEKGQLLLKGTRKDLKDKVEALEKAITELTESALKAENQRDVAAKHLELVLKRRDEVAAAVESRGGLGLRAAEEGKALAQAYTKAKAEVEALMKMERKATGSLKGLQEAKDKAYAEIMDLKLKMEKAQDRLETHFGLITSQKSKLPALEEQLGDAMVELNENPVEVHPGEEVAGFDDLRRELRNAETALERLGNVNMTALEQYDAQALRQAELKGEVARLESQREELLKLVAEITVKKKAALMEVFTAINENFQTVYKDVSLGGQAYMELENAENPFEGGLILKAQPPGKKVTRLDSLSGGEKSLTSMAFIFAIQRYDPSPFYYFDEVDQNLDAVNSELLAKMIRNNAQFAQFIVVSLRKITLKEASHIYGVTQQQPGLSEIIANFDIDTLKDDDKPGGSDGEDGPDEGAGPDLPPPQANRPKEKKTKPKGKPTSETTITALMERAVTVEVKP
ncbi:MAG: chromosome segregation protein SMC [Candidatus Thermoplasmatota archaeon]